MRTLLLADDNITVQRVIALTFAQEPVRILTASDGHQAMDRVVVDRPDIVLAGTTLPHVNGYDLSRFVKSKPESKHVPVLLLSGAFETIDEAELLASGANGVIEKPVEPTVVIKRVKELLGLKPRDAAPAAGRLVTPETVTAGQRPMPVMPRAVTTSRPMPSPPAARDERRDQTRDENAPPVEDATRGDDYLDSLGDAFDSLDQQLAGRTPANQQRNPSPPLGQLHQSGDPRSPGRMPTPQSSTTPGNPVYEVDEDWFGDDQSREQARAARRDMNDELRAPELERPPVAAPLAQPVYEVDDEWFAEDQKARDARRLEQRELAREMGIHEVEVPERAAAPAPVTNDDFAFGEDDLSAAIRPIEPPRAAAPLKAVEPRGPMKPPIAAERPKSVEPLKVVEGRQAPAPVTPIVEVALASAVPLGATEEPGPAEPVAVIEMTLSAHRDEEYLPIEPIARTLPMDFFAAAVSKERKPVPHQIQDVPGGPPASPAVPRVTDTLLASTTEGRRDMRDVADDFDALLAFEEGTNAAPPMIEPIIHAVTPEITAEMIEEIATTLADRLKNHVPAPEITGEVIKTIAFLVSGSLKEQIRVEPVAPQLTGEIIKTIAYLVSGGLKDHIRVEPIAPQLTGEIIETIAYQVSGSLKDHIRVEPVAPTITGEMLDQISAQVADRLQHTIKIEAVAPELTPPMLEQVAATVAGHLTNSIHVEPVEPQITQPMLDHIASIVSERLTGSIRVEPAAPKITEGMLDHIAGFVSERLKSSIRVEPVPPPQVSSEVAGHVAEQLAERLKASVQVQTVAPEITGEMLEHVAARVSERLQSSMPPPPDPPQITGDMLEHVAARVSERLQSSMPPPPEPLQITGDMLEYIAGRVSERLQSSLPAPPAPPEITDDMLERVAGRVAERVQGSFSIDHLRDVIAGAVRDTVRAVVSETSERLVREEIERIKSRQ